VDYLRAAKPRVVVLFLLTVLAAMLLAGAHDWAHIVAVLAATALTIAGAAILNNCLERQTDQKMARTRIRPTASGRLKPRRALIAGLSATIAGAVAVGFSGGLLAAVLAAAGALYYVVAYTVLLKPRTALSALPGGLAGVFPAAIGWAAAGAPDSPQVLVLCGLIFVWSPAHFWSLSLSLKQQYAAAGIPTPAVAYGDQIAGLQILLSATACVALTVGVIPLELFGLPYAVVAAAAGLGFWTLSAVLGAAPTPGRAWWLYKLSGPYLAVVVISMLA
jgi:protoheme IX farnesyltransferase